MRANVYRVGDPTGDTLTQLGYVNAAGEVYRGGVLSGRVTPEGDVLAAEGAGVGRVSAAGAIFRGAGEAPVGHVTREGTVYRGATLIAQAVAGHVDPRVPRAHMGGAALLLGLLD